MNTIKKISIHLAILSISVVPLFVYAQPGGGNTVIPAGGNVPSPSGQVINIPNPTKAGSTLIEVLNAILNNVIMPVAVVAVVVWIVWAGFGYILAQGNPKKIEVAHQRLLWSLIGAGILLGASGISAVVQKTISDLITK